LNAIEAAILGVVQGLTEFFPVSSSGHLALVESLFGGRNEGGLLFEVAVHVATLVAIAIYYRHRIVALIAGVLRWDAEAVDYVAKLAVATLPSVVIGLTAKDFIEEQFSNPMLVAGALLVTGAIVFSSRWTAARAIAPRPTWTAAVLIGLAQAFAILPGISRSGSTVAMALALGIAPRAAAEFSFLLGIIAITGAAVLMLPGLSEASPAAISNIGIGTATALASGLVAIWLFIQMLDRSLFYYWAWYCWIVGGSFLVWSLA
jgi:undecaprenyl-diphosphatase